MNSHREDKDAFAIYHFLSSWHFSVQNIKYRCKSHWPQPRQDDEFENLMQRINNSFTQTKSICQEKTKVLKKKCYLSLSSLPQNPQRQVYMKCRKKTTSHSRLLIDLVLLLNPPLLFCSVKAWLKDLIICTSRIN